MECGTAPHHVCNVLAVLGDGAVSSRAVLRAAVDLAEEANARLTLVKTCESGQSYVWIAPFAAGGAYIPPPPDSREEAARMLARATAQVPSQTPVTTILLGDDTQGSLLKLLRSGSYGALVAERCLLSRNGRLRRRVAADSLRTVLIGADGSLEREPVGAARALIRRRIAGARAQAGSRSIRSAEVRITASAASSRSSPTGSSS